MARKFPHLFSPFMLGNLRLKNRIVSTAHGTYMPVNGLQTQQIAEYQQERAQGGAGLIILEAASTHPTGIGAGRYAVAHTDDCIPGYRAVIEAIHAEGVPVLVQLYHPGRDDIAGGTSDGTVAPIWSASAVRCEANQLMPRAMSVALIAEIVASYGEAARRLMQAGADGIEISAHHGHLVSQFMDPRTNLRTDRYGGPFENRFRLLREIIETVRAAIGPDKVLGVRLPSDEMSAVGLTHADALKEAAAVAALEEVDFIHVTPGSCATLDGLVHVAPSMAFAAGYAEAQFASLRRVIGKPMLATGRINDPQVAEALLAGNGADLVGMTRALICDPAMPAKAEAGLTEDIRYCVGCNQACIGHGKKGGFVTCIQRPETGRVAEFSIKPAARPQRVLVAGGGPAGMKAAVTAARRGHRVVLCEARPRLGGNIRLAERLPGRSEFGGVATNLIAEIARLGVEVRLNTVVTRDLVLRERTGVIVVATGALPARPVFPGDDDPAVLHGWDLLESPVRLGKSVLIADSTLDWVGVGLAERLARSGHEVRLCALGFNPGDNLPGTTKGHALGVLHGLGVRVDPLMRLGGFQDGTAYFEHAINGSVVEFAGVDNLVLSHGGASDTRLEDELEGLALPMLVAGDALCARSVEEAVLEGARAGMAA
ncbi:oxidoreductase [Tabrizicola sp.]|uniref:oxidoreductase n=1 Tax=Tabrizicola sp. TaxID=2005166 RepID=UPI002FDCCAA6